LGLTSHYTSAAGLLGILESGKLWLSDVRHLNEPCEMIHDVTADAIRINLDARPLFRYVIEK
jgi:hypothetical protein